MPDSIAGYPIKDVSDQEEWLKGLVYSIPGVGKTYLMGQLQDMERFHPILWVDTEKGTLTIRERKGIDVVRVITDREKGKIKKAGWLKLEEICNALYEGGHGYRTIVIDNLSECERFAMEWTLHLAGIKAATTGRDRELDIPEQRDWGRSNDMVNRMVRAYRDLDANVFFTAHTREVKNDVGVTLQTVPGLPGQVAFKVAGFLDFVGYYYMKDKGQETNRFLLTQGTEKFIAKSRNNALPKIMENPTMQDIVNGLLLGDSANG